MFNLTNRMEQQVNAQPGSPGYFSSRVAQLLLLTGLVAALAMHMGCAVAPPTMEEPAKELRLSDLSMEEKVAQMFMTRYSGRFYGENSYVYKDVKRLVGEEGIGGVIPFFGSTHGTISNLNELQKLARIPLLMAADYERGVGQQLEGATLFPSNMAMAATGSPELAYQQGMVTAREARAVGVHITFAPVMDVNSNPDNPIINLRSYGDSPENVTRFGVQFIEGAQDNRLVATAKHFPGHGDTGVDSHTSLPVIETTRERFERIDLAPFKAAVDAGVKMIMVGHIAVPAMDEGRLPATLSPELNGRLLREELGFQGVIVTDAMEMGGITEAYWAGEAAILTIEAGTDMVLLPMDIDRAILSVLDAVKSGRISEQRIDESVKRILDLKSELGLWQNRIVTLEHAQAVLGRSDFQSIAYEAAKNSITLVKDDRNLIPIRAEQIHTLTHLLLSTDEGMQSLSGTFRSAVARIHGNVVSKFVFEPLSDPEIGELVRNAQRSDFILCTLLIRVRMNKGTVSIDPSHRILISRLQETGKPVVVVSFGSPYVADVDQIGTYLCGYGYGHISQTAMVNAIFGVAPITGKLSVTLSPGFPEGHGLVRSQRKMLQQSAEEFDFSEAVEVLNAAIQDSIFPGAQVMVTKGGEVIWSYQAGRQTYDPGSPPITEETIFDLASLTKVVATTPTVMRLNEMKLLPLNEPVKDFFPKFAGGGKENVTVRNLLTHSSGLVPYVRFFELKVPPDEVIDAIIESELVYTPGDSMAYSDLGLILMGNIAEKVAGQSLDAMVHSRLYGPLGMTRTFYNPESTYFPDIAPTEVDTVYRGGVVHGIVHDENAWWLGGVAGHAGLFSTASDLARYAQMLMDGGFFEGRRHFKASTIKEFTRRQGVPPGSRRALGWDTPADSLSSAGDYFTRGSFGHLGFTGTSMWIDPNRRIAVILLTNRVYPTRERGGIYKVRREFYNAVMKTVASSSGVSAVDLPGNQKD